MSRSTRDVPIPLVNFARSCHVGAVVIGFALHWPWLVTIDFLLIVCTLVGGPSFYAIVGKMLLKRRLSGAEVEASGLVRFNSALAAVLYLCAIVAFVLQWWLIGWILAGMVALASATALCGYCIGCTLYYQFKLNRYRIFGQ